MSLGRVEEEEASQYGLWECSRCSLGNLKDAKTCQACFSDFDEKSVRWIENGPLYVRSRCISQTYNLCDGDVDLSSDDASDVGAESSDWDLSESESVPGSHAREPIKSRRSRGKRRKSSGSITFQDSDDSDEKDISDLDPDESFVSSEYEFAWEDYNPDDVFHKIASGLDSTECSVLMGESASDDSDLAFEDESEQLRSPRVKTPEERKRIEQAAEKTFFWQELEPGKREKLLLGMHERTVEPGEIIVKHGTRGEYFFLIETGHFEVVKEPLSEVVHTYKGSGEFGELAIRYGVPRMATVRAKTIGILWMIHRTVYAETIESLWEQKREVYEPLLRKISLFKTLKVRERRAIADCLNEFDCKESQMIFAQNAQSDAFYIIRSGEVTVWRSNVQVCRLRELQCFGERGLMLEQKRSCTIFAGENGGCKVLVMNQPDFRRIISRFPSIERSLRLLLAQQTSFARQARRRRRSSIRVMDLPKSPVPFPRGAAKLSRCNGMFPRRKRSTSVSACSTDVFSERPTITRRTNQTAMPC